MLALKVTSAGDWASGLADDEFAAAFGIRGKPLLASVVRQAVTWVDVARITMQLLY